MSAYNRMSEKSGMRKSFSLAMVIMVMIMLSLLGTYVMTCVNSSLFSSSEVSRSEDAFYLAEAGLHWALQKAVDSGDFSDASVSLGKGSFAVAYSDINPAVEADLTVTGKIDRGGVEYIRKISTHVMLPEAGGTGGGSIDSVQYVGGDITIVNASGSIEGEISLTGDLENNSGVEVEDQENPDVLEEPPDFPFAFYKDKVIEMRDNNDPRYLSGQVRYITGDITLQGSRGTNIDGEGIFYYVAGDVDLKKTQTVYGTIICEGEVHGWNGDITLVSVPFDIDNDSEFESMPTLAAAGGIHFNNVSPLTIVGFIFSGGLLHTNNLSGFYLEGAMASAGGIKINNVEGLDISFNRDVLIDIYAGEQEGGGDGGSGSGGSGSGTKLISSWQEVSQ